MTDVEIITQLRAMAYMDCHTRDGEEPVHEMMTRQAQEAIK